MTKLALVPDFLIFWSELDNMNQLIFSPEVIYLYLTVSLYLLLVTNMNQLIFVPGLTQEPPGGHTVYIHKKVIFTKA
jgi:hypothetical protein